MVDGPGKHTEDIDLDIDYNCRPILDMSALDMILQKVTSIEGILRSSPLGDATRAAEAREVAKAKRAEEMAVRAAREVRAGRSSGGAGVSAGVAATRELKMIGGEFYMVINGNVYEYDHIEERKGAFVGRLKTDGESINTNAAEVMKGGRRPRSRKTQGRSPQNKQSRKTKSGH